MASLLDLQARGLSESIALGLLDAADVQELLDRRYPGHRFPPTFARLLHHKTDGSPLFLVDLLRWLGSRGAIADFEGAWQLTRGLPEVERDLPPSVRGMIQRKIEQLEESDRRLLTVASVQGFLFDSTVLADVLGMEQADVEERLTTLDKVYAFVRPVEEHDLPDGTLSVRHRFVHVLYQNALYQELQGTRRVQLATQVASVLETRYGARATEVAADLAVPPSRRAISRWAPCAPVRSSPTPSLPSWRRAAWPRLPCSPTARRRPRWRSGCGYRWASPTW
jgi:predicted ATPase